MKAPEIDLGINFSLHTYNIIILLKFLQNSKSTKNSQAKISASQSFCCWSALATAQAETSAEAMEAFTFNKIFSH